MPQAMRTLIFLTYQYPYLPGEYFIEEEIKYLSESFDRIYLLPGRSFFWRPDESPRKLPDNVILWDAATIPFLLKLRWAFSTVLRLPFYLRKEKREWPGHSSIKPVGFLDSVKSSIKALFVSDALQWFAQKDSLRPGAVGYAYWRDFGAAALCLARRSIGLNRVTVRAHRVDIYSPYRWPAESVIHREADAVFPVSEDGCRYLKEVKGLSIPKIEVRRLGVRIPEAYSESSKDGVLRVVTCSNLVPVKRVELIAQVLAKIPGPVEWSHIGDGEGREKLEEFVAREFDCDHKVNFLGRLANSAVYEYYQKQFVDVFINLSESEGVPVSIMEAMAHGIPCVATDVGGSAEIVNSTNGAVVDVDSRIEDICAAIEEVVAHKRLRESARMQAETVCSARRNYSNICKMLTGNKV